METQLTNVWPSPTPTMTSTSLQPTLITSTPALTSDVEEEVASSTLQLTPTPNLLTLPDWVTEPDANILLLGSKENQTLTIVDVDTGEQYNISANLDVFGPSWFWYNGSYYLSPKTFQGGSKVININCCHWSYWLILFYLELRHHLRDNQFYLYADHSSYLFGT